MLRRVAVTLGWATVVTVVFRWYELALRVQGLLLWTAAFLALYLASAAALHGSAVRERWKDVWRPAVIISAFVVVVWIAHTLWPVVRVGPLRVPASLFVSLLDVGLATWILVRAMLLTWTGAGRWIALGAIVPYGVLTTWLISVRMPGQSHEGALPPATPAEVALAEALQGHVHALATEIGPRNDDYMPQLDSAGRYIVRQLDSMGYAARELPFDAARLRFRNIEVSLAGGDHPEEIVVVGAHYDTAGDTPGADDNASGVAGLLELARRLRGARLSRTVRLVFFANEEPPFFNTEGMGSRVYAREAAARGDRLVAVLSLETIGFYDPAPGSQRYPFPFSLFYPDRGDFIGFVGNVSSTPLVRRSLAAFRGAARFPSQGVAAYGFIPGVWWSDHASFWRHGYPAIMVTNTAPYRNRNYHETSDTTGTLDYDRFARVVEGLDGVVRDLAGSGGS